MSLYSRNKTKETISEKGRGGKAGQVVISKNLLLFLVSAV